MQETDDPEKRALPVPEVRSAEVIQLAERALPTRQPPNLSSADALKFVRMLAQDSDNIVVIPYGQARAKKRKITRKQIEDCIRKGTIDEGPFVNQHGNWQMNFYRHAAGEELTCVVAIDWPNRVLVINTF